MTDPITTPEALDALRDDLIGRIDNPTATAGARLAFAEVRRALFRPDAPTPTPAERSRDCPRRPHAALDCPADDPEDHWSSTQPAPAPAGDGQREALARVTAFLDGYTERYPDAYVSIYGHTSAQERRLDPDDLRAVLALAARPSAPTVTTETPAIAALRRIRSIGARSGEGNLNAWNDVFAIIDEVLGR